MTHFPDITTDPDVNTLLRTLHDRLQPLLGSQMVGMYLYGSLASGGFDKHSDVDLLVVTETALTDAQFAALGHLHDQLQTLDLWCATQLESSYIPRAALRRHDPNDAHHPHIDRGRGAKLGIEKHDSDWIIKRYTLCTHGIACVGPPIDTLIDPVSSHALKNAVSEALHGWYARKVNEGTMTFGSRGYQTYIVLSMCRMLYTLEHGTIISKFAAAQWARQNLDPSWTPLIDRAWIGRQHPDDKPDPDDAQSTRELIRLTATRSQTTGRYD